MSSSNLDMKRCSKDADRISSLPNSILCHILSFLETKFSVQTCVLSKKWKSLWTEVPSLYFHRLPPPTKKLKKKGAFEKLVTMSMLMNKCQSLNKFRFVCLQEADRFNNIPGWLSTAISRDVRSIDLNLICSTDYFGMRTLMTLSSALYTCKSLEIMRLEGDLLLRVPSLVILPRLECLNLRGIRYGSDESLQKLIERCPVLKSLYIERTKYDNVVVFIVSSKTLRHLEIKASHFDSGKENIDLKLEINAPELKYFRLCDCASKDFSFKSLTALVELHLFDLDNYNNIENSSNLTSKLFQAFYYHGFKTLALGNVDVLKGFAASRGNIWGMTLTTLIITSSTWDWTTLIDLLHNLNFLQVLDLKTVCESFDERDGKGVPKCLSSRLKRISIFSNYYLYNTEDKMVGMVKYFLKHGGILKRMEIRNTHVYSDVLKKILAFSRKSTACEVHVF